MRPPKLHTLLLSHPRAIAPAPSHRLEIPAQKREERRERDGEKSEKNRETDRERHTETRVDRRAHRQHRALLPSVQQC